MHPSARGFRPPLLLQEPVARGAAGDAFGGGEDRVHVEAVEAVELGERAGLAEVLHPQRPHPMPAHTAELAERLSDLAPPGLDRVFFSNSGAEAVEAALKLARAATGRTRLVHAENSYHGKTLGALSVTGRTGHTSAFRPLLPDCFAVPYGDPAALAAALAGAAALILEPVQATAGSWSLAAEDWRRVRAVCHQADILLIADEVITAWGRINGWFALEAFGIAPDLGFRRAEEGEPQEEQGRRLRHLPNGDARHVIVVIVVRAGAAVVELPHGGTLTGPMAWVTWLGVHLSLLSGAEEKTSVFVDWGWTALTHHRGKRIILMDKDEDEPAAT